MLSLFSNLSTKRQSDISKAVFISANFDTALTGQLEKLRWTPEGANEEAELLGNIRISQEFGWSLEYCEQLDVFQKTAIFGFLDAQQKLLKHQSRR